MKRLLARICLYMASINIIEWFAVWIAALISVDIIEAWLFPGSVGVAKDAWNILFWVLFPFRLAGVSVPGKLQSWITNKSKEEEKL